MVYRKRVADKLLERKLARKGAVLIEGPKWCGKTTTAEQVASSIIYMSEDESSFIPHGTDGDKQLRLSAYRRSVHSTNWLLKGLSFTNDTITDIPENGYRAEYTLKNYGL